MRSLLLALTLSACSDYDYVESRVHDVFEVPSSRTVTDILFVVDDSASMYEEQQRLGQNFQAFVEAVSASVADYRIAVVTTDTDADDAGIFRGRVIEAGDAEIESTFMAEVDVGTSGSRIERGLLAADLAIDGRNPGFPRQDAGLDVVVLSDEDDQSEGSVQDLLQPLRDAVRPLVARVHAIVGDEPEGCASGSSAADAGTRYLKAAFETGGYEESICAEDFTGILTRLGLDVTGWMDTFALSQVPDPDTIVAWVDGVSIPGRDQDGWHYEPGDNAVVFTGRAVPRPGMEVMIEYGLLLGSPTDTGAG